MSSSPTINTMPSATSAAAEPSCTTAVPGKYGSVPDDACNSNYNFEPDFAANSAFAVLFGLTLGIHLVQAIAWKKRFCWVVIMAAAWEWIAFSPKSAGARDQQVQIYAILGQLFFLLAPLWMNAFVYMTVARLVNYVLPDRSIWNLKATQLTKIFVWIDVLCFLVQAGGGNLLSGDDERLMRIGQYIYVGGCGAQLLFIVIFCALMARLYVKMGRAGRLDLKMRLVRVLFWALPAVLVFIMVRIIFRLYEFKPGSDFNSDILTNEYYALGLDALPMFLGLLLLNIVHPGWVLRGPDSELPRTKRREKMQIRLEKREAKAAAKSAAKEEKRQKKAAKTSFAKEAERSSDTFELNEAASRRQDFQEV